MTRDVPMSRSIISVTSGELLFDPRRSAVRSLASVFLRVLCGKCVSGFSMTRDVPMNKSPDHPINQSLQLQHLQRTLRPVMPPADNQIAFACLMHVPQKI